MLKCRKTLHIFKEKMYVSIHMYMHVCMCIYCAFIHASVVSASARESAIDFSGACVYIVHLYALAVSASTKEPAIDICIGG